MVGLQTLVKSVGSGDLQKLIAELKRHRESPRLRQKMSDNLGGDPTSQRLGGVADPDFRDR
jgi:hypothetical protein